MIHLRLRNIAAFALLISPCSSIAVATSSLRHTKFEVSGQTVQLFSFIVDFDGPVFLYNKSAPISSADANRNPATLYYHQRLSDASQSSSFPDLVKFGAVRTIVTKGIAKIVCNGIEIPATASQTNDGPPTTYLTSPPTVDPAFSMLNTVFSGTTLPETSFPNRWAAVFVQIQNAFDPATLDCSVAFSGLDVTNRHNLVDSLNVPVNVTIPHLTYMEPMCTNDVINDLNAFYTNFVSNTTIKGSSQASQFSALLGLFTAKAGYNACKSFVMQFASIETLLIQKPNPYASCNYNYNTLEYNTSACCNQVLAATECCLPGYTTITQAVLVSPNNDAIEANCTINPSPSLGPLVDFINAAEGGSSVSDSDYGSLLSFMSTCQNCTYTGICNQASSTCQIDQSDTITPFLKCLLYDTAADATLLPIKLSLEANLGLSSANGIDAEVADFHAYLLSAGTYNDCVGPNSYEFSRRWSNEQVKDSEGNYQSVIIPANQTGCLSKKSCTIDPWQHSSSADCTSAGVGACLACPNGQCWNTLSPVNGRYSSAATCTPTCDSWDYNERLLTGANCTNLQYCTTSCPKCHPTGSSESADGIGFCYDNRNQSTCIGDSGSWNLQNGICQHAFVGKSSCLSSNYTYHSCKDLSNRECPINSGSISLFTSSDSISARLLKSCFWDAYSPCSDSATCLLGGDCDDSYDCSSDTYGQARNGACSFAPSLPWECGQLRSNRLGRCINSTITNATVCLQTTGNTWQDCANTKSECLTGSTLCQTKNGRSNFFNASKCDECQGTSQSVYNWHEPVWANRTMVPVIWKTYDWVSENQWIQTIDWSAIWSVWQDAASEVFLKKSVDKFNTVYAKILPIFADVGAACGLGPTTKVLIPTKQVTCCGVSSAGNFNLPAECVFNSTCVTAISTTDTQLANSTSSLFRRRLKLGLSAAVYEVVFNSNGKLIGQLAGVISTTTFSLVPNVSLQLCVTIDSSIYLNNVTYPVLDFAYVVNSVTKLPIETNVTIISGQYCAYIPPKLVMSAVPIMRKAVWKDVAVSSTSSTTSTTMASTPTNHSGSVTIGKSMFYSFFANLAGMLVFLW